jgi:hypothetical protein
MVETTRRIRAEAAVRPTAAGADAAASGFAPPDCRTIAEAGPRNTDDAAAVDYGAIGGDRLTTSSGVNIGAILVAILRRSCDGC